MTVESQVNNQVFLPQIVTVSQLNKAVREVLETDFDSVWVSGEISSFTPAGSGHWYFTIKDSAASVRAVMFRSRSQQVGFIPKVGDHVEVRCKVTIYEAKGEFQIQADQMRRAGVGNLFEAFVALKGRLAAEGLFDPDNKRTIARHPRAIGIITSLAAAALHDVLTALSRRASHVPVVIYPAMVQGVEAPAQLRRALAIANDRNEVDTILLVRGGGSIEDLWAFNDEGLARDIAASLIPVVSGVGHETDFTIADFVADLRAPTPTAAAELVCLTRVDLLRQLEMAAQSLSRFHARYIELQWQRLDRVCVALISPSQRLATQFEKLRLLRHRLCNLEQKTLYMASSKLERVQGQFRGQLPSLTELSRHVQRARLNLVAAQQRLLVTRHSRLEAAGAQLRALSPQNILERGYAILMDRSGQVVRATGAVKTGQRLRVTLSDGELDVTVQK